MKFFEELVIRRSSVVCTTLSTSGIGYLAGQKFTTLVVDEACQSTELSCLIPFQYQVQRAILLGDHYQLPATVFADDAASMLYNRSLFERLVANGVPTHMLREQYRMHPEISRYPSRAFYQGLLLDSAAVQHREEPEKMHQIAARFPHYAFIDLLTSQESLTDERSHSNPAEARLVARIVRQAQESCSDQSISVGIIAPYRKQVGLLRSMLHQRSGGLEINTVDSFQGREKDIVIITSVRANKGRGLGFLNDYRRMNVAITRAKYFLWVVGCASTLVRSTDSGTRVSWIVGC